MQVLLINQQEYILSERVNPKIANDRDVLIKVEFAGINRADLFQLQHLYPLPENGVAGLEVSGVIVDCGKSVKSFKVGDKVCALLTEGGFAEFVTINENLVFSVPKNFSLAEASCLPEACFTAWISLVLQANLQSNETILIHGGASGIGIIAIQIAKILKAKVAVTASSDEKLKICQESGADILINYKEKLFEQELKADVILDIVGGDYFERNLKTLKENGRLCIIAFLRGSNVNANISPILLKRLSIFGSTLRSRSLLEKSQIADEIRNKLWLQLEQGKIKPVIDKIFPLSEANIAISRMKENLNIGKILLKLS